MKNHRLVLPLALFAPTLLAQEQTVAIKPQGETPMRYTITSTSKIETDQKMLINGEERNFGRGGGGGGGGRGAPQGPTTTEQKLVFVDGGSWREYQTAEAKVTRPGWDGESNEQSVTGELQGKKVSLGAEPAVMGDGDKSTPLPANAVRDLPRKLDFSGFAPNKALALNASYELGKEFKDAIASLTHPVRAARGDGAPGQGGQQPGARRRRAQDTGDEAGGGDAGADNPAGGRRQRGGGAGAAGAGGGRGQGRGGFQFGGMGADNVALQILAAPGVQPKLTGKLVKVENGLATIEISGDASGKGSPDKLGLMAGMGGMFGRGRRGGDAGGEAPAPAVNEGNVKVTVAGTMVIDTASSCLRSLDLKGNVESKTHTEMSREGRDGETMEMETDRTQKGEYTVKVSCEPAK